MKQTQNRGKGFAGTIIFHAGLLLLFIFFGLSTPLPLPGEEGVEVNLGNADEGMGVTQLPVPAATQEEVAPPPPEEQKEEEIITQEVEETPVIEKPKEKEQPEKTERPEPVVTEKKPEQEAPKEPEVNKRALYKGKSQSQDTEGGQEGVTGKAGDQGKPTGDTGSQGYDGLGGQGDGVSYSLGGRGALRLDKPSYNSNDQGKVVVSIQVDRQGNVISAVAGVKGTTLSDGRLWDLAKSAALRSKFLADPKAAEVQTGTITYNFMRIN